MKYFYLLLFLVSLLACSNQSEPSQINAEASRKKFIVCTTGMLGDALVQITSDCEVHTLMGPGTDPHLFKPTKQSLDLLQSADVIVANGLHLEGRMQDILEKLAMQKPVIFAGNGIIPEAMIYAGGHGKVPDPHIWFDVDLWQKAVAHISDELQKLEHSCFDRTKSNGYLSALDSLNLWVAREVMTIPENQRVLITAHDAFSYFGKAYGVEVIALQGISTTAEYGVRDVTNMIELIKGRGIKAIFEESSIAPRSIEAVVAGCAQRGYEVKRGGTLYSDALGGKDSGAETYIDMVQHNVNNIKQALE
jgi:manganese/zinc/iron transport system substrate-binding protein